MIGARRALEFRRPAGSAPVANFTGTPTFGNAPLPVAFTDLSTNNPTEWLWEKNSGSGWVLFDDVPHDQSSTETLGDGTWSIRLTATNDFGSHTFTRTNYISAATPP